MEVVLKQHHLNGWILLPGKRGSYSPLPPTEASVRRRGLEGSQSESGEMLLNLGKLLDGIPGNMSDLFTLTMCVSKLVGHCRREQL